MPSFDIVSKVDSMEIQNAVHQAQKELATRFDFKGVKAEIVLDDHNIKLSTENEFQMLALVEIVVGKIAKRNIDLKAVDRGEPDVSPLGHARQTVKIKQGIDTATAKEIQKFIRDSKLKVTSQIQGDAVRVQGKNRDDLQAVITAVGTQDYPVALSYENFRN